MLAFHLKEKIKKRVILVEKIKGILNLDLSQNKSFMFL